MKTGLKLLVGLVMVAFLFGCEGKQHFANEKYLGESIAEERAEDMETPPPSASNKNANLAERKLIKEGYVSFETEDLKTAREHIAKAVKKYNAYLSSDVQRLPFV